MLIFKRMPFKIYDSFLELSTEYSIIIILVKSYIYLKSIVVIAAAAAKSLQSCPTLCDPMDSSPPGSTVHRILQARILEWVASFQQYYYLFL